jgi:Circularly permutated YpsA SLOG family
VADSDGTLIISNGEPIGGTRETVDRCVEMHKPYLVIDCEQIPPQEAIESALAFVRSLSLRTDGKLKLPQRDPSTSLGMVVMNVAGPRASQWPEGHALTYQIMSAILRRISGQPGAVG